MKGKPVIWAVVLAAGESTRMNGPKLALPFGQGTIIGTLIDNIGKSSISGIMVVLGAWREELAGIIQKLPVEYCVNENYKSGMLSSVICGLRTLPEDTDGAMIFPGDQPEITAGVVDSVIRSFCETGKGILIPVFKGKRGHPILIDQKYFAEVERLDFNTGLRGLSQKFREDVFEVETDNIMIIKDIDTKEDYLDAISKPQ